MDNINLESVKSFDNFPICDKTLKGLKKNSYLIPTKVQSQTLIHTLEGLDVVGAAKTGSGKTLAFIIPILEVLHKTSWTSYDGLGAIVITPTRELAYQIFDVLKKVGALHKLSAGLVIGGKDLKYEWRRITNCNIMICTPGRLLQHMTENPDFQCGNLQILVLDEADQCLSMGFSDTMNTILDELPKDRQTIIFSATQTRDIKDLIRAGLKNPVYCSIHERSKSVTPKSLKESYVLCEEEEKLQFLWSFLRYYRKKKILIFMATCKQVSFILDLFTHMRPGISVFGLHGGMHQLRRMAVYDKFCASRSAAMFSTDVAARGLDIPSIDYVVQLDFPENSTVYIHRVGRTARHVHAGEAVLVLTPSQEVNVLSNLKLKSINLENIQVNLKKMVTIQSKIDAIITKFPYLKQRAERALKSYLKYCCHIKSGDVFDISSIDVDNLARSMGLSVTPRIRFLEKRNGAHGKNSLTSKTKATKTFNLGIDEEHQNFLVKVDNLYNTDDSLSNLAEEAIFSSKSDGGAISQKALAKKLAKKNLTVNKRIIFDEDEGSTVSKTKEDFNTGIDIEAFSEKLRSRDKVDKEETLRIRKEVRRKERDRRKGSKQILNERAEECSDDDECENLRGYIDALPDPDSSSEEDSSHPSDMSDQEAVSNVVAGQSSESTLYPKSQKRPFKGKLEAKAKSKMLKRARSAADNDLTAISFNEKQDLALFLLKGGS